MNNLCSLKIKKKIFLVLLLFLSFILTACFGSGEGKTYGNLSVQTKAYDFRQNTDVTIPYINYDEIFDPNGTQEATGRYSDVTADGKISWNIPEGETGVYEQTPIVKEMVEKVTLDGKPVKFPAKFSDIDKNLSEFDNFDFSKLTPKQKPIKITDKKSGYYLVSFSGFKDDEEYVRLYNPNDNYMYSFSINSKDNKIYGIAATDSTELPVGDIRVDGIGIGSTFNEVYEKFGNPRYILPYRSASHVSIDVGYSFESDDEGYYGVVFEHAGPLYNNSTKKEEKTRHNVITSVKISVTK